METVRRTYVSAAGRDWALPLYDPLVNIMGIGVTRRALLDQAGLQPFHRVLDIGCGTGTLAILIKRLQPEVEVFGLDPDPRALARAGRKAKRAGVSIQLDRGFSDELPYARGSFDRVFSSFMLHHLGKDEKEKTLLEVRRVLKPGGSLHLVDFAGREADADGWLAGLLHSSNRLKENSEGGILALLNRAGFLDSRKVMEGAVLLGHLRIGYYRASAPNLP